MRILAGLQRPQTGRALVGGVDLAQDPRRVHEMVGFLPDFIGLYDALSGERHLRHSGACAGLSGEALSTRVAQTARRLDLEELLAKPAGKMSRGQRQRLAIAQALMKGPKLLILDEPASGLDPEARRGLSELLLQLKREGATMLVSSHILSELDDYSDRVAVMKAGRIVRVEALDASDAPRFETIALGLAGPNADLALSLSRVLSEEAFAEIAVLEVGADSARLRAPSEASLRARLLSALIDDGLAVAEFSVSRRRLQDAYFESDAEGGAEVEEAAA